MSGLSSGPIAARTIESAHSRLLGSDERQLRNVRFGGIRTTAPGRAGPLVRNRSCGDARRMSPRAANSGQSRRHLRLLTIGFDNIIRNTMDQSISRTEMSHYRNHFITLWRAVIAYPIAMAGAAAAFFPALDVVISARQGNLLLAFPRSDLGHHILRFLQLELGAVIGCFVFFGLPVLPLYAMGILVAWRLCIQNLTYYIFLGILLSLWSWRWPFIFGRGVGKTLHWSMNIGFTCLQGAVGIIGGLVCWGFLCLTYREYIDPKDLLSRRRSSDQ